MKHLHLPREIIVGFGTILALLVFIIIYSILRTNSLSARISTLSDDVQALNDKLASDLHAQGKNFYDMDQREIDNYLVHIFD